MDYTTQMDAARKGTLTEELKRVTGKKLSEPAELMWLVAEGEAAIPANRLHTCLKPDRIGSRLRTKINVNLGISRDCRDLEMELRKVNDTVKMEAEPVMDLSSWGDTRTFRRKLTAQCSAVIGTAPIYNVVVYYHKPLKDITSQEWLDIVRMHVEDGVDFMTTRVRISQQTTERFKKTKHLTNIMSRGGSIISAWMEMTGKGNPFYGHFGEILDVCQAYDMTLDLGDACRPKCAEGASDISQIEELVTLGELTRKMWEKNVQVIIEGPGYTPLDQIQSNMKIQQTICQGTPFYVLGPLVTGIAPDYDHVTAAMGGALAAASGASFPCYVTPAERLGLSDPDDVKEGIMASKIATHATDIAKDIKGAAQWDREMSTTRKNLDWERAFKLSIDPERARKYRGSVRPGKEDTYPMCGDFCAVKNMNRMLDGGIVGIFGE